MCQTKRTACDLNSTLYSQMFVILANSEIVNRLCSRVQEFLEFLCVHSTPLCSRTTGDFARELVGSRTQQEVARRSQMHHQILMARQLSIEPAEVSSVVGPEWA